MSDWSIRTLLNPVITRLLIYGVNPIDLEYVLAAVEATEHRTSRSLENSWLREWAAKAAKYRELADAAESSGYQATARQLWFFAAQCYYAVFLINLATVGEKERVYGEYAALYRQSLAFANPPVHYLEIQLAAGRLPGYLHLPPAVDAAPVPCAVIFSGLGSSKEEMHSLARPVVERGMAAFVPDMPGNGAAVFGQGLACRPELLQEAFAAIPRALALRPELRADAIGAIGLCMGGGYAHYAASHCADYKFCATLFPLFVNQVVPGSTPQWMKQGEWFERQTGLTNGDQFLESMKFLEQGSLQVPFLFIHGRYDNWMTLEQASRLYDSATGHREKIIIEEAPVFSGQELVTHTMPVGEQLHWLRYRVADWIATQVS